jgi:hypothetical protein
MWSTHGKRIGCRPGSGRPDPRSDIRITGASMPAAGTGCQGWGRSDTCSFCLAASAESVICTIAEMALNASKRPRPLFSGANRLAPWRVTISGEQQRTLRIRGPDHDPIDENSADRAAGADGPGVVTCMAVQPWMGIPTGGAARAHPPDRDPLRTLRPDLIRPRGARAWHPVQGVQPRALQSLQIRSAYSLTDRSLEKYPHRATFRMARRVHSPLSR